MMTNGDNQYLRLDCHPNTAGPSPLVMLAQTCSNIGNDSPSGAKNLREKPKKDALVAPACSLSAAERAPSEKSDKAASHSSPNTDITRLTPHLGFKPYENNPVCKPVAEKPSQSPDSHSKPKSKSPPGKHHSSKEQELVSPTIRPGIEMLQTGKEPHGSPYKSVPTTTHLEGHPAFRGLPPGYPYIHPAYFRKDMTPCKDPYCNCSVSPFEMAARSAQCPPGCTQCEFHKYQQYNQTLSLMLQGMSPFPSLYSPPLTSPRAIVCWVPHGDGYCGKNFSTTEELLLHMRSHSLPAGLMHQYDLFRSPSAPLGPLAAARYHPYSKPGPMPPSPLSIPYSAFNPPPLSAYYPFYGPRGGTSAVRP